MLKFSAFGCILRFKYDFCCQLLHKTWNKSCFCCQLSDPPRHLSFDRPLNTATTNSKPWNRRYIHTNTQHLRTHFKTQSKFEAVLKDGLCKSRQLAEDCWEGPECKDKWIWCRGAVGMSVNVCNGCNTASMSYWWWQAGLAQWIMCWVGEREIHSSSRAVCSRQE